MMINRVSYNTPDLDPNDLRHSQPVRVMKTVGNGKTKNETPRSNAKQTKQRLLLLVRLAWNLGKVIP